MANYQNLKSAISAAIRTNGNQEITGQVLQDVLNSIVSVIGANYTFAGVATPATNPGTPDQNVMYLAMEGGTYTNFNGTVLPAGISLLMWNGTWMSETVMYGDGGVFDISVYKSSGGTLATFADLTAALDGGNNIPASARKRGMSVKFVCSSDNKYIQARCMAQNFSTTESDWQGVDDEPTAGSNNLVKSWGIKKSIDDISYEIQTENTEKIEVKVSNVDRFVRGDNYRWAVGAGMSVCKIPVVAGKKIAIKINNTAILGATYTYFPWIFTNTNDATSSSNVITGAGETPAAQNANLSIKNIVTVPTGATYLYICTTYNGSVGSTVPDNYVELFDVDSRSLCESTFIANDYFLQDKYGVCLSDGVISALSSSTHGVAFFQLKKGEKYNISGRFYHVGSSTNVLSLAIVSNDNIFDNIGQTPISVLKQTSTAENYSTEFEVGDGYNGKYLMVCNIFNQNVTIVKSSKITNIGKNILLPDIEQSELLANFVEELYIADDSIVSVKLTQVTIQDGGISALFVCNNGEGNINKILSGIPGVPVNTDYVWVVFKTNYGYTESSPLVLRCDILLSINRDINQCAKIHGYFLDNNISEITDYENKKADDILPNKILSSREYLKVYVNSLKVKPSLSDENKIMYIKDTISGETDTAIHDGTIVYDDVTDILYLVSCCNNTGVPGDNPKSAKTTTRLDIVENYSDPLNRVVTGYTISKQGDIIEGFVIATGSGVPNMVKVGNFLYIFSTSSDVDAQSSVGYNGLWTWFVTKFDVTTKTMEQHICKCIYNGVSMNFNLPNILDLAEAEGVLNMRYIHQYFNNNATIAYYNGEYYMASQTSDEYDPLIFKTADFINWTFVCAPVGFKSYSAYECALSINTNGIIVMCSRGNNVNCIATYNLTSNKWLEHYYLYSLSDARPCFFKYGNDVYLWYTPFVGRQSGNILKINFETLKRSEFVFDVLNVGSNYPCVVNKNTNTLIVSRSMASYIGINEFSIPETTDNDIDSVFNSLFDL